MARRRRMVWRRRLVCRWRARRTWWGAGVCGSRMWIRRDTNRRRPMSIHDARRWRRAPGVRWGDPMSQGLYFVA